MNFDDNPIKEKKKFSEYYSENDPIKDYGNSYENYEEFEDFENYNKSSYSNKSQKKSKRNAVKTFKKEMKEMLISITVMAGIVMIMIAFTSADLMIEAVIAPRKEKAAQLKNDLMYKNVNFELSEEYINDFENTFASSEDLIFDNGIKIPLLDKQYDKYIGKYYIHKDDNNIVTEKSTLIQVEYISKIKNSLIFEIFESKISKFEGYTRKYYNGDKKVFIRDEYGKYFSFIIFGEQTIWYGIGYGEPRPSY